MPEYKKHRTETRRSEKVRERWRDAENAGPYGSAGKNTRSQPDDNERNAAVRRYNERKRRQRRARFTLAVSALFVLTLALGVVSIVFFNLAEIEVTGNSRYTAEQVEAASGLEIGKNILLVSSSKVREAVYAALPYIGDVKLTRGFPSSIELRVAESEPYAYIRDEEGDRLIVSDESGRAMEVTQIRTMTNIPIVCTSGVEDCTLGKILTYKDTNMQKKYVDIIAHLKDNNMEGDISIIDMRKTYFVKLVFRGNVEIWLGQAVDLDYKLEKFKRVALEEKLYDLPEEAYRLVDVSADVQASVRPAVPNDLCALLSPFYGGDPDGE